MATMTLEQHWYGSSPYGLKLARGFQTLGRTPGLPEDALLERHCAYKRPIAQKEGNPPVNWGWFELGNGLACIHRIGYSGTDEVGRPGNFLAHSLIARTADLKSIDYDIPSLIRWVRFQSPQQYPLPKGGSDGFVRHHNQLYQAYSKDKEKLRSLPPLQVPLDAVRAIRQQTDAAWETEIVAPLREKLKEETLTALLQAVLCETEQRRPILFVSPTAGDEESSLELKILEFLFVLLPATSRAGLTFSTYDHEPLGSSTQTRPGSPPPRPGVPAARGGATPTSGPHKNRRLVITSPFIDVSKTINPRAAPTLWFINPRAGQATVPPPNLVSAGYDACLRQGNVAELQAQRELASCFEYPDEWSGLVDPWGLRELLHKPLTRDDYALFARAAEHLGKGASAAVGMRLLDMARRLVAGWDEVPDPDTGLLKHLAAIYLHSLASLYPTLPAEERAARRPELVGDLGMLFRHAVRLGAIEVVQMLVRYPCQYSNLADFQAEALGTYAVALGQALDEQSRPPQRVTAERVGLWADLWDSIYQLGRKSDSPARALLMSAADAFTRALCATDPFVRPRLRRWVDALVLPVFALCRISDADELARRLAFLGHMSPREGMTWCAKLLVHQFRKGLIDGAVLAALVQDRHDLLLRFYEAWRTAMNAEPGLAEVLRPALGATLLQAYWKSPPEQQDALLHQGVRTVLSQCPTGPEYSSFWDNLAQQYLAEGAGQLAGHLHDNRARSLRDVAEMAAAHCQLLDLLDANASDPDRLLEAALRQHHAQLLVYLLSRPPGSIVDDGSEGNPLREPLQFLGSWYRDFKERMPFLTGVIRQAADALKGLGVTEDDELPLLGNFRDCLKELFKESSEPWWYVHLLEQSVRKPDLTPEQLETRVTALVLQDRPDLAEPVTATGSFRRFIDEHLSPPVWQCVVDCAVEACRNRETGPQAMQKWFDPKSAHQKLLFMLEQNDLVASLGETLAQKIARTPDVRAVQLLDHLVAVGPPRDVLVPARRELHRLVTAVCNGLLQERQRQRQADPGWMPRPADAEKAVALCRPLQLLIQSQQVQVAPELPNYLWGYLAECLVCLSPAALRQHFPAIFSLGYELGHEWRAEPPQPWASLFRPLAKMKPDGFAEAYVAAGESLFADVQGHLRRWPGAEQLAVVRQTPEVAAALGAPAAAGGKAPAAGKPRAPDGDRLAALLSVAPPETGEDGTISPVVPRARFAAVLYGEKELTTLAEIYWKLGQEPTASGEPGHWQPGNTAYALAAYLTLEGPRHDLMAPRANRLVESDFMKVLARNLKKEGEMLCNALTTCLKKLGASEGDADKIQRPFRRKL